MANQNTDFFGSSVEFMQSTSQSIADMMKKTSAQAGEKFGTALYELIEGSTEAIGMTVTPIVTHPFIKFATKLPGINWLMAAVGQVDVDTVQQDVETLRRTYPLESQEELAHRVIIDTSWNAAGVGLATNFIPPLALGLLAIDLGAVAALQAKMIYRIAAIYGFAPTDPTRRGEVLAIWGLSTASSGTVKAGMSIVEIIPFIGAASGVMSNAAMLYGLGQLACRFYEAKQRAVDS